MDYIVHMLLFTLAEAALLVTALSLDAFTVCLAYGTGGIRIPPSSLIVISVICSLTLAFSLLLGATANLVIPQETAKWIGFAILLALGLVKFFDGTLKAFIRKHGDSLNREVQWKFFGLNLILYIYADPERADRDHSRILSPAEACSIAFALSLDGLAAGFSAGLSEIPIMPVFLLSFAITALAVLTGGLIGRKISERKPVELSWLSGIILIVLAFIRL